MKHPRNVEGYNGSLEELAKAIGNMSYDQVAIFLEKLAEDLNNQAEADKKEKGLIYLQNYLKHLLVLKNPLHQLIMPGRFVNLTCKLRQSINTLSIFLYITLINI